jgi:hypothetical protein
LRLEAGDWRLEERRRTRQLVAVPPASSLKPPAYLSRNRAATRGVSSDVRGGLPRPQEAMMKRGTLAALVLASTLGLGGCVFAAGTNSDGDRIERLERRVAAAEKALNIQQEPQK